MCCHDGSTELKEADVDEVGETTVCANHPNQPTTLRCNRCDKPICTKCAQRTPVGYRCKKCVRGQQSMFETVLWRDYVVTALIAILIHGVAGILLVRLGWFAILLAPMMGGFIANAIRRAINRRRGRYLAYAAVAAMVLASLPNLLFWNVWSLVYLILSASTVYVRLRGTSI